MQRQNRLAAIGTCAVILAAGVARGAEGVLEISQTCALVGCFAGDTAGFPVTTAPAGNYILTSNLTVPNANTTAISLGGRSTLDLNGFAILGPTSCAGEPATCTGTGTGVGVGGGSAGGIIRNGTIRGMGSHGVWGGDDTRVEAMRIEGNGGDGVNGGFGSHGWLVERCSINSNGGNGINVNFGGGGSTVIRGNSVRWNGGYGAIGFYMLVVENTFLGNESLGVSTSGGGYGQNVFEANNGGANQATGLQVGSNVCEGNTTCP